MNLHTLLFYTCLTKEVANQCEEGFTIDQAGIANRGFSSNLTFIEEAHREHGMEAFFAVHDTLFVNGQGLRKDWQQAWATAYAQVKPLIQSGAVVGWFLGDELFPGKISVANFTAALETLAATKKEFPDLLIWENQGGTGWIDSFPNGLPAALDITSIDDYYLTVDEHRVWYTSKLYPLLAPHQKVFLVPGSYGTRNDIPKSRWCLKPDGSPGETLDDCDNFMVNQTQAYLNWALQDERIVGFAPWHWDSRGVDEVSPSKEVGTVELPKLTAEWKKIGAMIVPPRQS